MMPADAQTIAEILDAALEYLDKGFSVIPVGRDKRPLVKWDEFQKRHATREEVETWWAKWPNANVAIICGKISGIFCVDADGPHGEAWIAGNLPVTGVYSKTLKGIHAIFLVPPDAVIRNKVRLAPEVDIRGEGGYFVAPPSIHESGHVYEWMFTPGLNGWDDLAEYAPPDPIRLKTSLNLDLSKVKAHPVFQPVAEGRRNDTLAQLAGRWIALGLSLDEVLALARSWNAENRPPLGEFELRRTVQSILEKHRDNHPPIQAAPPEETKTKSADESILQPGGLLQDIMSVFETNSAASHPLFDLAGAIALVGTVAGQKFMTESGLRTNFYCFSLGTSGSGKNAPMQCIPNILAQSTAHDLMGSNEFTSHSAILQALVKKPVHLMLMDEIGHIFKAAKTPNSPATQVFRLLSDLFSKTNSPYVKTYASKDDILVHYHHLSVYGTGTPERFWESLSFDDAKDGFLARTLIFCSNHDAELPRDTLTFDIPCSVIAAIDNIFSVQTDFTGGNLIKKPIPRIIPKTEDAQKCMAEWHEHHHILGNQTKQSEEGISALYRRAAEHAHKLALVHAVSLNGPGIERVEKASVKWAHKLMDYLIEDTIMQLRQTIAVNELDALRKKIIRVVKKNWTLNKPGATKRELFQNIRGLTQKSLDIAVEGLMESGELQVGDWKSANNKTTKLYFVPEQSDESA